jgi:hypothetical protein
MAPSITKYEFDEGPQLIAKSPTLTNRAWGTAKSIRANLSAANVGWER